MINFLTILSLIVNNLNLIVMFTIIFIVLSVVSKDCKSVISVLLKLALLLFIFKLI